MKEGRSSWRVVPILAAIVFLSHFNRISMTVAGDTKLMPEFGISPVRMGWVYSAFILVYTIAMVPAGLFADRFGTWLALGIMLVGTGVLEALTGLTTGIIPGTAALWIALLLVRAMMGLLTSPLHPSSARTISTWVPAPRQNLANGLVTAAAGLGVALTFTLFGTLIARVGMSGAFVVAGLSTVGVGAVWLLFGGDSAQHRRDPRRVVNPETSRWTTLLKDRRVRAITLAYGAMDYVQYLFFYWMHYYFGTVLTLDSDKANLYSTIPLLAFTAAMPIGGLVGDRLTRVLGPGRGPPIVPALGMLLGAAGLAAGVAAEDPVLVVICFSAALFGIGAAEPVFWTVAVNLGGPNAAAAAGIMNTGGNLGGFLAPIITPWLSSVFGWGVGLSFGALVCLTGTICWRWIRLGQLEATPSPASAEV